MYPNMQVDDRISLTRFLFQAPCWNQRPPKQNNSNMFSDARSNLISILIAISTDPLFRAYYVEMSGYEYLHLPLCHITPFHPCRTSPRCTCRSEDVLRMLVIVLQSLTSVFHSVIFLGHWYAQAREPEPQSCPPCPRPPLSQGPRAELRSSHAISIFHKNV